MLRARFLLGIATAFTLLFGSSNVTEAQAVKPWFLIVLDTSGSMVPNLSPTLTNSCGFPTQDRLSAAKCAINNIVNSTGDAEFGLMQFQQNSCNVNDFSATCNDTASSGYLRVGISSNPAAVLALVDGLGTPGTQEICGGGYTPLGGTLRAVRSYFEGGSSPTIGDGAVGCRPINVILLTDGEERCQSCQSGWSSCPDFEAAFPGNTCSACVTGGANAGFFESAPEAAYDMFNSTVVPTGGSPSTTSVKIRTYVIGFGISSGNARIERIALGGGTDNPSDGAGGLRGFYADNEAQVSEALAQIIFDSQLNELCNGVDDDCDEKVDEGHVTYCDPLAIRSQNPQVIHPTTGALVDQASVPGSNLAAVGGACTNPAGCTPDTDTPACCGDVPGKVGDTNCSSTSYSTKLTCESPAGCFDTDPATCAVPANILCENPGELCDGMDNNCNGLIDEPPIVGTPPDERCGNSVDDDCDGDIDEGCPPGCSLTELCNGLDDDCDNATDEDLERPCGYNLGVCQAGFEICTDGGNGDPNMRWTVDPTRPCILPSGELCDGLDNDCDGSIDDGVPTLSCDSDNHMGEGECEIGIRTCNARDTGIPDSYGACEFEVRPSTEICDGKDNDCDGEIDEADGLGPDVKLSRPCGTDAGICVRGNEYCTDGDNTDPTQRYTGCDAVGGGTEICNRDPGAADQTQFDEDCDGRVDESDPQQGAACIDNGGVAQIPPPSPPAGVGICTAGQAVCYQGQLICPNYGGPETEVCDNVDHNCNGQNVDGVGPTTSDPNAALGSDYRLGTPCGFDPGDYPGFPDALLGIGDCNLGKLVCDDSVIGSEDVVCIDFGAPSTEICNGEDDDCDGRTDENVFPDNASSDCQTGVNAGPYPYDPPRQFCGRCVSATGARVVCSQALVNDDPNNAVTCGDLGYGTAGSFGGVADCCSARQFTSNWDFGNLLGPHNGVNECEKGRFQCLAGVAVCANEITPGSEVCDGLDNDCDQKFDEFAPGVGEPCGTDVGICMKGTQQCTGAAGIDCIGEFDGLDNELCNGLDDDCDGFVDEGNPEGGGNCGGGTCRIDIDGDGVADDPDDQPCGDCQFGVETCETQFDQDDQPIGGILVCVGSVEPGDELCDGQDNDCDSRCRVDDIDPQAPVKVCDPSCSLPTNDPNYFDCDAKVDEGVDVTDDRIGDACGDTTGECDSGMYICLDGELVCDGGIGPVDEICNGLDDDCDGITDDGIPVGAPCGDDTGECQPGVQVCDVTTGMLVCQGEVGPADEVCDGLDNDCDTKVDEGLGVGEACGSDVGLCKKGALQCVNGRSTCVGEMRPSVETCDCEDNDCDGKIDEEAGQNPLCPGKAACVMCQCALPCSPVIEFASACPQGKAPVETDDGCYCVGEQCKQRECQETTLEVDDVVQCAPDSDLVGICRCKNNECSFACSGVVCDEGLVCDPTDGRCKVRTCLLPQFRCADDESCRLVDQVWTCVDDPCADVDCADDESCRDGSCIKSCAKVECASGNKCVDGTCVADNCKAKNCTGTDVCDPTDGKCKAPAAGGCHFQGCTEGEVCEPIGGDCSEDPCLITRCPFGEQCNSDDGQCELRCGGALIWCDSECINPLTDKEHCGATAPCMGDNLGDTCGESEVCSKGECGDSCADDLLNCDGECIDPSSDQMRCGAKGDCQGDNAGEVCRTGSVCREGQCERIDRGDGGGDGDTIKDGTRVIASGGGGCTCSVPGAEPALPGSRRGPLSLLLLSLALAVLGRRRWRVVRKAVAGTLLALVVSLLGSGCKIDTFCLDCEQEQTGGTGITGGSGGIGGGRNDGGGIIIPDSSTDNPEPDAGGGKPDGGTTTLPDGAVVECRDVELCNAFDDDCDGKVDEDVDTAAQNIDLDTDVLHCGKCGNACAFEHAFPACVSGECEIDRDQGNGGCDVGYHDLDGDQANGCEYRCLKTADDDTSCDLRDNDCDNKVDEDVDFDSDVNNCGTCGTQCRFVNAANGGTCVAGECKLDDTKCDDGFRNLDGVQANGCEKSCQVFPPVDETCNRQDDDCDGKLDEGVGTTDARVGVSCRTDSTGALMLNPAAAQGICVNGTSACIGGSVQCEGETRPTTEICNGVNDDCDGATDETDQRLGGQCGSAVGECVPGAYVCNAGKLECGGPNLVLPAAQEICNNLDDDCDGRVDEQALSVGSPCTTRTGSLVVNPTTPVEVGNCHYGVVACVNGSRQCQGEVIPQPEQCDNTDWDCNGDPVNGVNLTDSRVGQVCGNQLGICEPGDTECVDTDPGAGVTWEVKCSPGSVEPDPNGETCNGLDDDCDGKFDEFNGTDPPIGAGGPCYLDQIDADPQLDYVAGSVDPGASGLCVSGTSVCSGGTPACVGYKGPQPEICDGLDNDCNGVIDDNPAFDGLPCNHLTSDPSGPTWPLLGECSQGVWDCPAPSGGTNALVCVGGTRPAAVEVCNGLDDDCDGQTDNNWDPQGGPTDGQSCCPAGVTCTPGSTNCDDGQYRCLGESGVSCVIDLNPTLEECDGEDNDCNGQIDETFAFNTDKTNCGGCGIDCDDPLTLGYVANAIMVCNNGVCQKSQCKQGYFNKLETSGPQVDDCAYACTIQGDESCNGDDDDCDGLIDAADPDWAPPPDSTFCNQVGPCFGSVVQCNETTDAWECTKPPAASESCNGVDDDCDGRTDEGIPLKSGHSAAPGATLGADCLGPGVGGCRLPGKLACAGSQYICAYEGTSTELPVGPVKDETSCDNVDNDCDGQVDERCDCEPGTGGCSEMAGKCIWDEWAPLPNGGYIFAFEASRPDADGTTAGGVTMQNGTTAAACSANDRMPWTNVSYANALAACQAVNSRATLCPREAWRDACSCGELGTTGSAPYFDYGWSYASCATPYNGATCNGTDYAGTDAVLSTGTAMNCYRTLGGIDVLDLSGNVKELTLRQTAEGRICSATEVDASCSIMVRGGAMNNTAVGTACGFERSFWPNDAPFNNVGFRCCMPVCQTFTAQGLPANANGDMVRTLTVSAVPFTTLTSIDWVSIAGETDDINDFEFTLQHGGNSTRVIDNQCGNGSVDFDITFDDSAASASPPCDPLGGGGTYRPNSGTLASLIGGSATGTWTLDINDNSGGSSDNDPITLTEWSIRLCGN